MAAAVSVPYANGLFQAWHRRYTMPSCLPKGLRRLALPRLFLPDETVKEVNNLAELTRLECTGSEYFWPSQNLVGLKVRFIAARAATLTLL